jgi:hypothetical protein
MLEHCIQHPVLAKMMPTYKTPTPHKAKNNTNLHPKKKKINTEPETPNIRLYYIFL